MEVDIRDLSLAQVVISKPKKQEDSLFGRISFGQGNETAKTYFYNVQCIHHKRVGDYSVIYIKVPRPVLHTLAEFDEHAKAHVRENAARWFTKSLDENVIDEYYMSSLVTLPKDGTVAKLKLIGSPSIELLDPGRYDLMLGIKGLRFFKQRFVAEWELLAVKRLGDDMVSSFVEEEDSESGEADAAEVLPTDEEMANIVSHLRARLDASIAPMQQKIARLVELRNELEKNSKCIAVLDKIAEDLDNEQGAR